MEERKAALKEAGFKTQEDAAKALGVSRHTIHRWVNGEDKQAYMTVLGPNGQMERVLAPVEFALACEAVGQKAIVADQKKLRVATKSS